jgi:Ni/Fe-hydrogenase subunit HybB-like protein
MSSASVHTGVLSHEQASTYTATLNSEYGRQVERDMLGTLDPLGPLGRIWIGGLLAIIAFGVFAYTMQLLNGLQVTAMRNYVSWGLYMANFVFFIGISHAGTLISAILRVTNAEWRRPITRMAEAITVFALLVGAPMVIIDMGRPDRVFNVFLHGRLQSPILWDVCSIATYLTGSMLYLYIAMIPDMPILARRARALRRSGWLVRLYDIMSLGYQGTPAQEKRLNIALAAMAVIIIPVAISVHTVVSWVFGMTVRPGWHSTIFGPYFVVGAIFSGTAAIITAMAVFRRAYRLERYLTLDHFRKLALLLLALTLLYVYFTLSEYLTTWYGGLATEARMLELLMGRTAYGAAFWGWVAFGLFLPIGLLLFPGRRSLGSIVTASVLINVGMWVKRYLIVVPTLETPYIPASAADATIFYFPTWIEWSITAAALATFLLLFTLFSRVFPIVSIWETAEDGGQPEPAPAAERAPVAAGGVAPALGRALVLLLGAVTVIGLVAVRAHGQHPAAGGVEASAVAAPAAAPAQIAVERLEEGGETVLLATVMVDGEPVAGVLVGFYVRRLFGDMLLGEDITLGDGSAAVPFPEDLPGNEAGALDVIARILSPDELAGAETGALLEGGLPAVTALAEDPRALWSSRTPLALVVPIVLLLSIVWATYSLALYQLVQIRKLGKEPTGHETV